MTIHGSFEKFSHKICLRGNHGIQIFREGKKTREINLVNEKAYSVIKPKARGKSSALPKDKC